MSYTGSCSVSVSYTTPGNQVSRPTYSVSAEYAASNSGFVDIPAATAPAAEFDIPFGSVASAKGVVIQNLTDISLTLQLAGATGSTGAYSLPAGSVCIPTFGPTGSTLASAKVVTGATAATGCQVSYVIIGD